VFVCFRSTSTAPTGWRAFVRSRHKANAWMWLFVGGAFNIDFWIIRSAPDQWFAMLYLKGSTSNVRFIALHSRVCSWINCLFLSIEHFRTFLVACPGAGRRNAWAAKQANLCLAIAMKWYYLSHPVRKYNCPLYPRWPIQRENSGMVGVRNCIKISTANACHKLCPQHFTKFLDRKSGREM